MANKFEFDLINTDNTIAPETNKTGRPEFLSSKEHAWLASVGKKISDELNYFSNQDSDLPNRLKKEFPESSGNELNFAMEILGKLETVADKDGLTHLENRCGLFKKGVEYFSAVESLPAADRSISVVGMDIDFFKAYNEISHSFGDIALQKVGQVLLEYTKDSGFSARLGGEEIFILVEKQISEKEIIAKALEIKDKIHQTFKDFFNELDAQMGRPQSGVTADFLENAILTESRNQSGFNNEMSGKKEYDDAKLKVKQIKAFDFNDEISPADFVLKLKNAINQATGVEQKELLAIKSKLGFEVGTVTLGAIHVKFDNDSIINASDLAEMVNTVEIENIFSEEIVEEFKKTIKNRTYKQIYELIGKMAGDASGRPAEFWQDLIENSRKKRFGRIVDKINFITEEQKKKSRNSFGIVSETMENLDATEHSVVNDFILTEYNSAKKALAKLSAKNMRQAERLGIALVPDEFAEIFSDIGARINPADRDYFQEIMKSLRRLQAARYYDSLTGVKNYAYLSKVIDNELSCADKMGADYAVISLDIDNLKAINAVGGYKFGDIALMNASYAMQKAIVEIPKKFKNKIDQTGLNPSVIRATGGEEFIITLPGLNSAEAQEVFNILNEKMAAAIRNIVRAGGYEADIKKYIGQLNLQTNDGRPVRRGAAEIEKFGSATAGVVSLREVRGHITENKKLNAGKMRQIADTIGERLKNTVDANGISGRGRIGGLKEMQI